MFYKAPNTYINEGTQFTVDGVTYPSNWLNQSTPEQKEALGLVEVVTTNQPFDPRYYWTGETLNGATLTYTGTAKDLDDVQKQAVAQINDTAYSLLFPTDWMVVKAMETSLPMDVRWSEWRTSIRLTAANTVIAIAQTTDVDAIAVIMANLVWANNPDYVAPTND